MRGKCIWPAKTYASFSLKYFLSEPILPSLAWSIPRKEGRVNRSNRSIKVECVCICWCWLGRVVKSVSDGSSEHENVVNEKWTSWYRSSVSPISDRCQTGRTRLEVTLCSCIVLLFVCLSYFGVFSVTNVNRCSMYSCSIKNGGGQQVPFMMSVLRVFVIALTLLISWWERHLAGKKSA